MILKLVSRSSWALPTVLSLSLSGCSPGGEPRVDSQTNWLRACEVDADCGGLLCQCGACTRPCGANADCADLDGASCVPPQESGVVALCSGAVLASPGFCLPRCIPGQCTNGAACVSGICSPTPAPTARVAIELSSQFQTLVGLGASIAYVSDEIAQHTRKVAMYESMFAELGLDMLRFRNRYGNPGDDNLSSQSEILAAATSSLGHAPVLMLTSWSPPAALKANGASICAGAAETCTLKKTPSGVFDYDGFANHWRASLEAYSKIGVSPDFIGIQNHPNWTPTESAPMDGCMFLPKEGPLTLTINGVDVQTTFPGFVEAMSAVAGQLAGLARVPQFAAPEINGAGAVADYAAQLDFTRTGAIAHHVYDFDLATNDTTVFTQLGALGRQYQRPTFLTEGAADGFGTAVLMHYSLAVEGASVYLQNDLVGSAFDLVKDAMSLISLSAEDFMLQGPYHSLRHYALYTDPGWVRVGATSTQSGLLSSAWLSPGGDALTVVMVNLGPSSESIQLALEQFAFKDSRVVRTVFDGIEQFADLGPLAIERVIRVPSRSISTVALRK